MLGVNEHWQLCLLKKKKLTEADLGLVKIYSFHKQQSPTQESLCYERVFWTIFWRGKFRGAEINHGWALQDKSPRWSRKTADHSWTLQHERPNPSSYFLVDRARGLIIVHSSERTRAHHSSAVCRKLRLEGKVGGLCWWWRIFPFVNKMMMIVGSTSWSRLLA